MRRSEIEVEPELLQLDENIEVCFIVVMMVVVLVALVVVGRQLLCRSW